MIRIGEHKDVNQGATLLKEFVKEFDFGNFKEDNTNYYKELMVAIATDKTSVVSVNDEGVIDGVLLGMRTPNILNPQDVQFQVIVTWVHPDKRGSSIFYRMNKFLEDKVVNKGEDIIYHSINETNINHKKLGYENLSTLHIKRKQI